MEIIACDEKNCTFTTTEKKLLAQHMSQDHPTQIIPPAHGHGKRANAQLVSKETKKRVYNLPCPVCSRLFLGSKALQEHGKSTKHSKQF